MPTTAKRLQEQASRLAQSSLNLLFPPRCGGCARIGYHLCEECLNSFDFLQEPLCQICSEPLASQGICWKCEHTERSFERVISVFAFTGAIQKSIHAFKYKGRAELAEPFVELMHNKMMTQSIEFDFVSSVPMHASQRAERRYNHAALLAEKLSTKLNLTLLPETELIRIRRTVPQIKLAFNARQENVKGAFSVQSGTVRGKRVLLVDDVFTTGATLDACAHALRMAGASRVVGLTLTRAVFQSER